jgi:2-oxo-3-hexenedioate decarboxylase
MGLTPDQIHHWGAYLDAAANEVRLVPQVSAQVAGMTLDEAYLIQRASMQCRAARGDAVIGMKMGLTSLAKMEQMGVHDPIYGHLTSTMLRGDGDAIARSEHGQPRVEPEIAFLMGRDLEGPTTPAQAMLAVEGVCASLEVIDSRYADFKFSLEDVVADNASSTRFVLGSTVLPPEAIDIANLGMVMRVNGKVVGVGSSAAILDHPARSLARLANMLHAVGERLHAGQIVLAGGATAAVHLNEGDRVRLDVDQLGSVETHVTA